MCIDSGTILPQPDHVPHYVREPWPFLMTLLSSHLNFIGTVYPHAPLPARLDVVHHVAFQTLFTRALEKDNKILNGF